MDNFTAYIVISLLVLLIVIATIKRKSNFIAILLLLFMWSLCIFCTNAFDLHNMKYVYDNYPLVIEEYAPGFDILLRTCVGLGLNFTVFKAIIGAFSLIMTYMAIRKSTEYFALVIGLYAVYPFISTVSQIRNGMMAAIVMYSLICFILDPRHSTWKYVFGIILASMFHPSAVFYLIFIFAKAKINKRILFIVVVLLSFFVNILIQKNLLYPILSQFISNTRTLQWFDYKQALEWSSSGTYSWKLKLLLILTHVVGYVFFYMILRNCKRCMRQSKHIMPSKITVQYFNEATLDFINRIELLLFLLFPLYMLSANYLRIYKNVILLMYIVTAQYFGISMKSGYRVITARRLCLGVFLYALLILFLEISIAQGETIQILNSYLAA